MKNSYWKKRFKALEDEEYQRSAEYYKDLQEQFRQAKNSIQMDIECWYQRLADNNDISLAAAKRLLKKDELEEFHWTLEQYIKKGKENCVNQCWMKQLENASARHHISYLEAMKLQIQQHEELLFTEYENGVTDFLHKSYVENYYHTAYEIAKGTSIGSNLAVLDERRIDKLLKKPWAQDGANFSDRIWTNKQKLVNNLHTELSQSIIRGEDPQKAINRLAHTMDVSKAQAGNLIMTESSAIASAAQKDCFNELGVERYEIVAALDSITCDVCQDMDGKTFKMKEFEVGLTAPPFHPRCRCCEVPYFDDEFTVGGERAARGADGKTYYVPADMKYKDWKEKYVKSGDKPVENISLSDIMEPQILNTEDVISKAKELSEELLSGNEVLNEKDDNPMFEYVTRKLGYNKKPEVVDSITFEKLVKESPVGILYRGVNADTKEIVDEYINNFKSGRMFTGKKQAYGHGIYFSPEEVVAIKYKKNGQFGDIIKVVLREDAKVIDYMTAMKEYASTGAIMAKFRTNKEEWEKILPSVSEFIAIKGYDAIALNGFNGNQHIIVLNRGKVVVER